MERESGWKGRGRAGGSRWEAQCPGGRMQPELSAGPRGEGGPGGAGSPPAERAVGGRN